MTCVLIEQLSVEYEFDVTLPEDILMLTVDFHKKDKLFRLAAEFVLGQFALNMHIVLSRY
jgi:DUF1365 family protein